MTSAGGPTKISPASAHALGESGVFGEETIARMDCDPRRSERAALEERRHRQVALARRRRTDRVIAWSAAATCGAAASAAENTATLSIPISAHARMIRKRNLTAVGDQEALDHRDRRIKTQRAPRTQRVDASGLFPLCPWCPLDPGVGPWPLFSRNARSPSCPSGDTRRAAIAAAVIGIASAIGRPHTRGISAFAAAIGFRSRASAARATYRLTAASSSAAGTTLVDEAGSRARGRRRTARQ